MSFSSKVKSELLTTELSPCCKHAQSYGLLLFGRAFSLQEMSFLTENIKVARAYCDSIKNLTGKTVETDLTAGGKYKISTDDRNIIDAVIKNTGMDPHALNRRVNFANLSSECCFSAFLRGAFLACGTVANPEKEYHLEFSVSTKGLCDDIIKIFDEFDPVPKMTRRGGAYIVYFKSSSDIEDVLAIMGATECSLEIMGAKVYKDIRNTVNRKVNFENANLARTIAAASKQYEAIVILKDTVGFDNLPEELREIAQLRFENREMSNAEIGAMLSDSLSISGINHRFKKLIKLAEEQKK